MIVAVDPRLELLSIVQSSVQEYTQRGPLRCDPLPYLEAAFDLARRHEDHAAVRLWRELHADGFTFDAPVRFALSHSALPAFAPTIDYREAHYLVHRAKGADRLAAFGAALRDFAASADLGTFLARWRRTFEAYESQARSVIDPQWPAWLDAYAGRPETDLRIALLPLSRGSYGPTVGGVAYAVVASLWNGRDAVFDDREHLELLVLHEGAHGFVNPAMFGVQEELEASAVLLAPMAERMAAQAYPRWITVVCEHVVRAVVARLSPDREAVLAREEGLGFVHIRAVAEALAEYERSRDRYPTLASFAPRIAEVFRGLAGG